MWLYSKVSGKYVNLIIFTACPIAHLITYSSLNMNTFFVSHRFCLHQWCPFIFSMRQLTCTIQNVSELQTETSFPYPLKCCYLQSKCFHFRIHCLRIWTPSVPHECQVVTIYRVDNFLHLCNSCSYTLGTHLA